MSEHDDELMSRIAAELRHLPRDLPEDFDARVMRRVAALPPHARRGNVRAFSLRRSPVGGLALAAGLGAFVLVAGARILGRPVPADRAVAAHPSGAPPGLVLTGANGRRVVEFVLFAPGAKSVTLVGDFNDWDRTVTPLRATHPGGVWSVAVPLPPGRHRYAFVVDGTRWLADPAAPPPRTPADDDYGDPNSIVTVGA